MAIVLTDRAEQEILEAAYVGESVIVGLYYETGDRLDSPTKNYAKPGELPDGVSNDEYGTSLSEGGNLSRVAATEPSGASYSRQETDISQTNIRRDAGFSASTDLSSKVSLPPVIFDVSDSEYPVNAVFVIYEPTGNIHFNTFLDQTYKLSEYNSELTISNVELVIE